MKKKKGRWDKSIYKTVGYTYVCPQCNNKNDEPLEKEDGTKYCSSCLVKTNKFIDMKKRLVHQKKSKQELKSK